MKKKELIFTYVILGILLVAITVGTLSDDFGNLIANIITTLMAIVSAVAVYLQMKKDTEITKAEFLLEFSKVFYSYKGAILLEEKIDNASQNNTLYEYSTDDYELVNDYMLWLEALASMIENNTLSISLINELYNYRFFNVVNNPSIQENELCRFAQYYDSIFVLHQKWVKYRKKNGLPILNEEYDLSKSEVYLKTIKLSKH